MIEEKKEGKITVEWDDPITKIDPTIPMRPNTLFPINLKVKFFINSENTQQLVGEFFMFLLDSITEQKNKTTFTIKKSI